MVSHFCISGGNTVEVSELKLHTRQKNLNKFYIFCGNGKEVDLEIMQLYIHKIAETLGLIQTEIDGVANISGKKSLFGGKKLYVCRYDDEFIKHEKAWDNLQSLLGNNYLILVYDALDKRGKFYKHFKDSIVEFVHIEDIDVFKKHIGRVISLSESACEFLVEICENDWGRILLELDKIKQMQRATPQKSGDALFKILLDEGSIYQPPEDAIFKFVDACIKNNASLAFDLLEDCKKIGEPALVLISVLYSTTKKVLQVQSCPSKDVASATGLEGRDVYWASKQSGYRANKDLIHMLRVLRWAEVGIKTGQIEESLAIDYVMVNIF